ncbi:N-acetyltransferase family protein [Humidisolicoccus flavus]|uniref:GNAT family N-acetyltransferase n=1 Tax=Humidisolicoccus flavus TaxID=3111414 RepID=UPI003255BDF7
MTAIQIRAAVAGDAPSILGLIQELADYEKESDAVKTSVADLDAALFGDSPAAFAHLAVDGDRVVGLALWFLTYSTWEGKHGIYLEDLYVSPDARGAGLGKRLIATLAALCTEREYRRLEWSVLRWNDSAIGFYDALGGTPQSDWERYRLDGEALRAVAAQQ